MNIGIIRLFMGYCGKIGYYNLQEIGLAKALAEEGLKTFIFLLDNSINGVKIEYIEKNVSVVYIPAKKIGSHGLFNLNLLKQFDIDILHVASDIQIFAGKTIKWCLKNNIKTISYFGTVNTSSGGCLSKFLTKLVFIINKNQFNKVINVAKNPKVYEELKSLGVDGVEMIPVGLDKTLLNNDFKNNIVDFREEFKIPLGSRVVTFIGRLEESKNPIFILKLFEFIISKDKNYHLLLVGKGKLKNEVKNFIINKKLGERVTYIEKMKNSEMWKVYTNSDVFLNACDKEIFGMCILEAMYYKCPVVALQAPGPGYIIDNKINGYLLDNLKYENWYNAINEVIVNRDNITKNAKNKIENELIWDAIANKYINLYKKELRMKF